MYKRLFHYLIAFLPLLFGGLLYVFFRNENILFFSWLRFFGISYSYHQYTNIINDGIASYVIYSLPNGLWVLSGLLFLNIALKREYQLLKIYSVIFIGIAFIIEIGQLFKIIRGTFCILDFVTIILFSSIGLFVNIRKVKYEKN